jgi:hypothetical protein
VWYPLPGPLPAGLYHIQVSGVQDAGAMDARLHVDVLLRRAGANDQTLTSADSIGQADPDAGVFAASAIDARVMGAAASAAVGDLLVLSVKMVAGSAGFLEISTQLTVP